MKNISNLGLKKIIVSFLFLTLFLLKSYTQKTEIRANANAGLFAFRGTGANSNATYIIDAYANPNSSLDNSYSNIFTSSHTFEVQFQRVVKNNNIIGIGFAIEKLKNKINVDSLIIRNNYIRGQSANGSVKFNNTFYTVNPYLGNRYTFKSIAFDVLAGLDVAFAAETTKKEIIKTSTQEFRTSTLEFKKNVDFRIRLQLDTQIKNVGLVLAYSRGLFNFSNETYKNVYSDLFRFGLSFKLK